MTIRFVFLQQVKPFIPLEFTAEGFLQRLNFYLKYQNFCETGKQSPMKKALQTIVGRESRSCEEECQAKGSIEWDDLSSDSFSRNQATCGLKSLFQDWHVNAACSKISTITIHFLGKGENTDASWPPGLLGNFSH